MKSARVSTMTSADSTLGAVTFIALHAIGSAAASTVTVLDGTAIKFVGAVATTANYDLLVGPTAFANLIVDLTGTASYSIISWPRP